MTERIADSDPIARRLLVRTLIIVAALNLAAAVVEIGIAISIGSVSLFADSIDFLEDTAVNLVILIALGWSLRAQSITGKALAGIILLPALAALWQLIAKIGDPTAPDPSALVLTAAGAGIVNLACALLLMRVRHHAGSMSSAAFLAARNDVLINLAIIVMGMVTAWTRSGWPDIALGAIIIVLNVSAAKEVWEASEEERIAARALAGEGVD